MDKSKIQKSADDMQKRVDLMQADLKEIKKALHDTPPKPVALLRQTGVLYAMWDTPREVRAAATMPMHSFNSSGRIFNACEDGGKGCGWNHHCVAFPQWIDIPKDVPHDADELKGRVLLDTPSGQIYTFANVIGVDWKQVSRVCILDSQD